MSGSVIRRVSSVVAGMSVLTSALLVGQTAPPRLPPAPTNPPAASVQAPIDPKDDKTLYVTNGATLAAFDVQRDGSLTNQREFAKFTAGGGDGATLDSRGRLYVTTGAGVEVIASDGKHLGIIPTPRAVISCAFGGNDKKTLFILARGAQGADGNEVVNAAQVWSIPMIAQGNKGRAK